MPEHDASLRLQSTSRIRATEPSALSASGHRLLVGLRGRVTVRERGEVRAELAADEVLWIDARREVTLESAPDAEVLIGSFRGRAPWPALVHLRTHEVAARPALRALLDAIAAELSVAAPHPRALGALLDGLTTHVGRRPEVPVDPYVARAVDAVKKDPRAAWTLASLARAAGLSPAAFARRFRRALGVSPLAFVQDVRMRRAAERLAASEESLAEIAVTIGYASEFAFAKAFKRRFGIAPGLFRRQQRTQAPTRAVVLRAVA